MGWLVHLVCQFTCNTRVDSLVGIAVGIASSTLGLEIYVITAAIKKYN